MPLNNRKEPQLCGFFSCKKIVEKNNKNTNRACFYNLEALTLS